ncbi:nitroreductase family protein [Sphingomonas pokkalii]|uniref:Nitroreductase family protein n=1 Tax=Sphingomonas pokkalii TaxID=2175090 RepID=A0A2U0SEK1_9SPHN|nr:nitroreductase family protein [Sphingomonas pokkalii]PVX29705.1 nitroreductase family protein [Sphingomonas pokkalii]
MTEDERTSRATAFLEQIASRHSCRSFSSEPVASATIEAAIRAAGSAPSGANRQPWHFAVLSTPGAKTALRVAVEEEERNFYGGMGGSEWQGLLRGLGTTAHKPYLELAPWVIIAFGITRGVDDSVPNPYVTESVGIACGLLLTALHEAGLATLVHSPTPARFLNRLCRRPGNERPIAIIVVGHAAEDATIPEAAALRKPLDQISSWL